MTSNSRNPEGYLRFARDVLAGALTGVTLLAIVATLRSLTAWAGDENPNTAVRLYLAVPFIAMKDRQPARLGFQLLQEDVDGTSFAPLDIDPHLDTTFDLGFTTKGLAKFDVKGTDAMSAYEVFARAIGLTPDEVELCRDTDCLDWVKQDGETMAATTTAAVRLGD